MKRSDKITLAALVAGIAVGLVTWWYFPGVHWGWHAAFGFFGFCILNVTWMAMAAIERSVDRDP